MTTSPLDKREGRAWNPSLFACWAGNSSCYGDALGAVLGMGIGPIAS
jgi:hypothetical protein